MPRCPRGSGGTRRDRTDGAYFAPLDARRPHDETALYLGLIHHDDGAGDAARMAAARRVVKTFGVTCSSSMLVAVAIKWLLLRRGEAAVDPEHLPGDERGCV